MELVLRLDQLCKGEIEDYGLGDATIEELRTIRSRIGDIGRLIEELAPVLDAFQNLGILDARTPEAFSRAVDLYGLFLDPALPLTGRPFAPGIVVTHFLVEQIGSGFDVLGESRERGREETQA